MGASTPFATFLGEFKLRFNRSFIENCCTRCVCAIAVLSGNATSEDSQEDECVGGKIGENEWQAMKEAKLTLRGVMAPLYDNGWVNRHQ